MQNSDNNGDNKIDTEFLLDAIEHFKIKDYTVSKTFKDATVKWIHDGYTDAQYKALLEEAGPKDTETLTDEEANELMAQSALAPDEKLKLTKYVDGLFQNYLSTLHQQFAHKIKFLSLSGGGAKIPKYIGAYKALKPIFDDIEEISGISAGAITAAFMAVGMDPEKIQTLLAKNSMLDLLGPAKLGLQHTGEPLEAFINDHLKTEIREWLEARINPDQETTEVERKLNETLSLDDHQITFQDLSDLREIDPKKFKHLNVFTINKTTIEKKVFSSKVDVALKVPICKACHASAAIPVVLAPVKIDEAEYVDGGYHYNNALPDPVGTKDGPQKMAASTLVLAFGTTSEKSPDALSSIDAYLYHNNQEFKPGLLERFFVIMSYLCG